MSVVKTCWHHDPADECSHPLCKRIAALESEIEALRKDAERGRFIMSEMGYQKCGPNYGWTLNALYDGHSPQEAIDAAMKDAP